jgi:serine/threonine-protein kinase RsbW
MSAKYELTIPSDLSNLARIGEFISGTARKLGLNEDEAFAVEMSVDEACANVMTHAYCGESGGPIEIECHLEGDRFVVTIRDQGEPFDPGCVPCPDTTCALEEREIGGLGIHFMRALMDEVNFEFDAREGNTLTMTKAKSRS